MGPAKKRHKYILYSNITFSNLAMVHLSLRPVHRGQARLSKRRLAAIFTYRDCPTNACERDSKMDTAPPVISAVVRRPLREKVHILAAVCSRRIRTK